MNMRDTKDGCFGWLFFLALLWEVHGIIITMDSATKLVTDNDFAVMCRDNDTGLPVTWCNPKGAILGDNTRPKVVQISFGTLLLFIGPHKVEDSGNYTCLTEKEKRVFQLFIENKPPYSWFDKPYVVTYGYVNGTVILTCSAEANLPANFTWMANDSSKKIGRIINESPHVSILQLYIDTDAVFGNYKCVVKNRFGSYEKIYSLKKAAKPVEPREFRLKAIGSNSITLEIVEPQQTPEVDFETKGFSVQYKKIDDEEWKQEEFSITPNNSYILNNLDSKSEYEMQVATRNFVGLSYYLPPKRATTSRAASFHVTLSVMYSIGAVILLGNCNLSF